MGTQTINRFSSVQVKHPPVRPSLPATERRVARVAHASETATIRPIKSPISKARSAPTAADHLQSVLPNRLTMAQIKRHKILSQGSREEKAALVPKLTIDQLIGWFETNPHKDAIMTVVGLLTEQQLDDVDGFIQQLDRQRDAPNIKKR